MQSQAFKKGRLMGIKEESRDDKKDEAVWKRTDAGQKTNKQTKTHTHT